MHVQARDFIDKAVKELGPFTGDVVEIGSQDVNGGLRDLFPQASSYVGIDIMAGPSVDLVIDAADWQPAQEYSCIVSTETFEHTPRWPEILKVCAKALTPDGVLLVTCATNPRRPHSAHTHGLGVQRGEYYANVPLPEFRRAAQAAGLKIQVTIDNEHGDLYAVCRLDIK